MKELEKFYITPKIKEKTERLLEHISTYDLALDIGISVTSLRSFILGKGLKEELFNKVAEFFGEKA